MSDNATPHPGPERLQAFRDGLLADREADHLEDHLLSCVDCQSALDSLPQDDLVRRCRRAGAVVNACPPLPPTTPHVPETVGPSGGKAATDAPADLVRNERYEILEKLGVGGMGAVYKARHKLMDRIVAIKVLSGKWTERPESVDRFHREVRACARLEHPNIVQAFDADKAGSVHFLVMEYVEGVTLAKHVEEHGPLPVHDACSCIHQAALGLQHAFEQGMVHRDLKPHNLMRTPQGCVKVLDFGLARLEREGGGPDGLTRAGLVMGTPDFMAPEQADDSHTVDIRADLYSLGCTLYYLLTGRPPFPGGSMVQKLAHHQHTAARLVHEVRPGIPPELSQLVARLLAKRPEDRFQTPAELAQALAPFLVPPSPMAEKSEVAVPRVIQPPPLPLAPRRHRLPRWLGAAAALLALLGFAVYRIATNTGVVEIDTDDDSVEVLVTHNGERIEILDGKTKRRIVLRCGIYEFKLADGKNDLRLETDRLVLSRGEKEIVRVKRVAEAKPAAAPASPGLGPVVRGRVPADDLDRRMIPPYELAVAGNGDPKAAPVELVAILGDSPFRHCAAITSIAYSPDGKIIASGSHDSTVRLWDAASGAQLAVFTEHRTRVLRVVFSPDGKTLASVANEPNVILYDVETKRRKTCLVGRSGFVSDLAFHRDGKLLASVECVSPSDHRVALWDLDSGTPHADWLPPEKVTWTVAFSPDGEILATGGEDRLVTLWDWKNRKVLRHLRGHTAILSSRSLSFHPDGTTLLSADTAGTARLWDVASGEPREPFRVGSNWTSCVFSPTGKAMALWDDRGTLLLYDDTGKHQLAKLPSVPGFPALYGVAFSPDGKTLALGDWDAEVKQWDLGTNSLRPHPGGEMGALNHVAVSPNGRWLASASADTVVRIWDLQTGRLHASLKGHEGRVGRVAFSPDGKYLASGADDSKVCLWEVPSGGRRYELQAHTGYILALAFSRDGQTLASASSHGTVCLWDVASGTLNRTITAHKNAVTAVGFSRDGKQVVTASRWEKGVRFWDPATAIEQPGLKGESLGGQAMGLSPDGGLLITGGNDQPWQWHRLYVWDYFTRTQVCPFEQHNNLVNAVDFGPDGTAVSTASDGLVCLWDPHTAALKRPPIRVGPEMGWVTNAVFTPEGRHLVIGNRNGTIYVLRLAQAAK
jgi:WD40 repeat protein